MVQGEGFEPPKAKPDDLQSPLVDHLSIPARKLLIGLPDEALAKSGAACRIRTDDIQFTKLTL
jgi:hypothetical protein